MQSEKTTRPVLGRRKTSERHGATGNSSSTEKLAYSGDEDALTKIGNFLYKIHSASILTRYALYILPVAALLAVPVALTATVYGDRNAGNIRLLGLFIWIEIIWFALWMCKLIAHGLPFVFEAVAGLISGGIRKYSLVLISLEIPVSLFLWSIVSFATTHVICVFNSKEVCNNESWFQTLQTVFKAGIVGAAIFLAEKTIIQLVSINYHRKTYHEKIKESKKLIKLLDLLYDASRAIFPEYCHEFEEEDGEIQGNTLADVRTQLAKAGVQTKVFDNMGRVRDKMTAAFGAMASDIAGKEVFSTTSAHNIVIEALETPRASKALARRLWLSFVGEGRDVLLKQDLIEVLGETRLVEAEEIFALLDRDANGDVSLDEMTLLIVNAGQERKNRASSMHDISQAIAVLDRLLSLVVLVAIAFVYATFFSKTFASKTTQLWTTFTGLAFAIGGTVTEFLGCCIFLFVKHPYDVGDRVTVTDTELIVERISLMYSVFRRIDTNSTVQIPHNIANTLWIENISRSKAMKERLTLAVAATTSHDDILALRGELTKFVTADENRRDFQPDFDVELRSVGDLKQLDLRVEIRHKSNFANESVRNMRRNKFMCELLAAARRIPLGPPGGSAAPLGDPSNPAYSVAISDLEGVAARERKRVEVEGARLVPVGGRYEDLGMPREAGVGTAFNVVGSGAGSLLGRRGSVRSGQIGRRSGEGSMLGR
ncbi:hypothetical protein PRZ48_002550 [Zasmidium cellare]|uniref:Mechanosensitive ion channel protein n=1 Tax=Zasmidium cellare TaxID=395010 RepID=A0ABR0F6J5_ZASCE|nr:hypothetical protein PRZ48_002550 [Zasmidium cellare]